MKKLHIADDWWAKEQCSLEVATFLDAKRLYDAKGLAMGFKRMAEGLNVEIYGVFVFSPLPHCPTDQTFF